MGARICNTCHQQLSENEVTWKRCDGSAGISQAIAQQLAQLHLRFEIPQQEGLHGVIRRLAAGSTRVNELRRFRDRARRCCLEAGTPDKQEIE